MKVTRAEHSFCLSCHQASICQQEKSALSVEAALCPITFIDVTNQNRLMLDQNGTTIFCPTEETSPCWTDTETRDGTEVKIYLRILPAPGESTQDSWQ